MNIAENIDEIIERHYNMVIAAHNFFGHDAPKSRITHQERDDCNHFVQYSMGDRIVFEITTELRGLTLTVKVHNFVVEVMEVFSVTAKRK